MHSRMTRQWVAFETSSAFLQVHCWLVRGGVVGLTVLTFGLNHAPVTGQEQGTSNTTLPNAQAPQTLGVQSTLQVGSQGEQVAELQALLKLLGYYSGSVDGLYQDSTAIAVASFQQSAGLQADGIVGPATWNRLLPPSPPVTNAEGNASPTLSPAARSPAPSPSSASANPQLTGEASSIPASRTPNSSTPSQSAPVDLPVLRMGMRGPAVARLQERLQALGVFNAAVDGVFGSETQAAVKIAQRRYRLNPDGVVGSATWTALLRS